jgi:hypothetical protein
MKAAFKVAIHIYEGGNTNTTDCPSTKKHGIQIKMYLSCKYRKNFTVR